MNEDEFLKQLIEQIEGDLQRYDGSIPPILLSRTDWQRVLDLLKQRYSSATAERIGKGVARAKRRMRREGRYLGGKVPFGWQVQEGNLIEIPEEQEAIREMIAMQDRGESLRQIEKWVKSKGFSLSHQGVSKVIRDNRRRNHNHS